MSWWESAYRSGRVPWDPGPYDGHLPRLIERYSIAPCPALDIGCGTGKSLVWLARRGFSGTGIDLAPSALRLAEAHAAEAGVRCRWLCGRFPDAFAAKQLPPASFGLVMERGCLQHLRSEARERRRFLEAAAALVASGGFFYSLVTSSNRNARHVGPPQWSAAELVQALEPCFEIRLLEESVFTPGEQGSVPAWLAVAQPRR